MPPLLKLSKLSRSVCALIDIQRWSSARTLRSSQQGKSEHRPQTAHVSAYRRRLSQSVMYNSFGSVRDTPGLSDIGNLRGVTLHNSNGCAQRPSHLSDHGQRPETEHGEDAPCAEPSCIRGRWALPLSS